MTEEEKAFLIYYDNEGKINSNEKRRHVPGKMTMVYEKWKEENKWLKRRSFHLWHIMTEEEKENILMSGENRSGVKERTTIVQ